MEPSLRQGAELTVANDDSVYQQRKKGVLILACVVLEQRRGVKVTDAGVVGTLSSCQAGKGSSPHKILHIHGV